MTKMWFLKDFICRKVCLLVTFQFHIFGKITSLESKVTVMSPFQDQLNVWKQGTGISVIRYKIIKSKIASGKYKQNLTIYGQFERTTVMKYIFCWPLNICLFSTLLQGETCAICWCNGRLLRILFFIKIHDEKY